MKGKNRKLTVARESPRKTEPPPQGDAYPNFAARQKRIFGKRPIHLNIAEILIKERNRF